jgi:hypothetical protein
LKWSFALSQQFHFSLTGEEENL